MQKGSEENQKLQRIAAALDPHLAEGDCVIVLTKDFNHLALPEPSIRPKTITKEHPMYRAALFLQLFEDGNEDVCLQLMARLDKAYDKFMARKGSNGQI